MLNNPIDAVLEASNGYTPQSEIARVGPLPPAEGLLSRSIPRGRADLAESLLAARARLWKALDETRFIEGKLRSFAERGGCVVFEQTPSVLVPGADPDIELTVRMAEAPEWLDRIDRLRKEIRARQQEMRDRRGPFKQKKNRAGSAILDQLRSEMEAARTSLGMCEQDGIAAATERRRRLGRDLAGSLMSLAELDRLSSDESELPWDLGRWQAWEPTGSSALTEVRIGTMQDDRSGDLLDLPLVVPFIGAGKALVLASQGDEQHKRAATLMQSLVVRTVAMLPQQARYTLLDPAGNGLAFPMARNMPRVSLGTGDIRRDLDDVTREIQRVIRTYLDPSRPTFEDIPDEMRLAECYHFVFVADFPNGYDLRAREALQAIARTGPNAGVYVVLHLNRDKERQFAGDPEQTSLEGAQVIDMADTAVRIGETASTIVFDEAPSVSLQELIFTRISLVPPRDQPIAWDDLNSLEEDDWWKESSDQLISAPIGRHGGNQSLSVWFGTDQWEQRACVHGILGAMPGAGKSTLFHNLISALAIRYSPEQLRFLLIDGKFGVEFQPYVFLPHASVVSLRTSPAMSRSVLSDAVAEMARRNGIFARCGVVDLPGYRQRQSPEGNLPRLLLIIDEYQQLFDGDRDGEASANLLRLSQQGRSSGIHMLLASQRFDTAGMLHRADIFGNMHLRIAMQLAQADAATLTDFGIKGRRLIAATCDRTGRLVMNERAGDDEANVAGKAALIDSSRRDQIIAALARKASSSVGSSRMRTVVFHGQAQPDFIMNPHVQELASRKGWRDAGELENFARTPVERVGLGESDWLAAERPLAFFVGQEFNVRGHASVVVRRRAAENVLILGENHLVRLALATATLVSAALVASPPDLQIWVSDRSIESTPWSDALANVTSSLASVGYDVSFGRDMAHAEELIQRAVKEVERRAAMPESELLGEPSIVFLLQQPDRVTSLRRLTDDFGRRDSEAGVALRQLLVDGPTLGIHLVLAVPSLGVLRSVVADRVIQSEVRHRLVLQMSEDDSFALVRSALASKLQADGDRPVAALAFDSHSQSTVRFKPYSLSLEDEEIGNPSGRLDLMSQVARIVRQLADRVG